jgi:hypothetical protein
VSVVGGSEEDPEALARAEQVGTRLADRGHVLVCGGLGGVMAAACRGAREADGTTVGILPGEDPTAANPHVTVPVATGLGHARNALVVMNGAAVVAVGGAAGTLSELGYAGVFDRPVAGLDTHDVPWVEPVASAREAVAYVERATERSD